MERTTTILVLLLSMVACVGRETYYEARGPGLEVRGCYGVSGREMKISDIVLVRVQAHAQEQDRATIVEIDIELPAENELRLLDSSISFITGSRVIKEPIEIRALVYTGAVPTFQKSSVLEGATVMHGDRTYHASYRVLTSTDGLFDSFVLQFPEAELNDTTFEVPRIRFALDKKLTFGCGELGPGP